MSFKAGAEIPVSEINALRPASRARGVDDVGQSIVVADE
jgi:hypothetical protein